MSSDGDWPTLSILSDRNPVIGQRTVTAVVHEQRALAHSSVRYLIHSDISCSGLAPPAGFEPALPPPESGTQLNSCDVLTSRNQLSAPPHLYAWTRIGHSTGTRRLNRWERYGGGDL
jgi:hypothetical protein